MYELCRFFLFVFFSECLLRVFMGLQMANRSRVWVQALEDLDNVKIFSFGEPFWFFLLGT